MSKYQKGIICKNCVFYSQSISKPDWGTCKYNPPTAVLYQHTEQIEIRPNVMFDDWCGMYREKINDADRGTS